MFNFRERLLVATICAILSFVPGARADGSIQNYPVPPDPSSAAIAADEAATANPLNMPVTGATQLDKIVGGDVPPSLEALQDVRPGDQKGDGLKLGRAEELRSAAHIYGHKAAWRHVRSPSTRCSGATRRSSMIPSTSARWCCRSAAARP